MNVAILGGGVAGYTAAWAAISAGHRAYIITSPDTYPKPVPPPLFLFQDPMGLPLRGTWVDTSMFGGTPADYREKVYKTNRLEVSAEKLPGQSRMYYDGVQGLQMMVEIVSSQPDGWLIHHKLQAQITGMSGDVYSSIVEQVNELGNFGAIISTIPYSAFAPVAVVEVWTTTGNAPPDEAYMLYNANPRMEWYRASAVFGRFCMEWAKLPAKHDRSLQPVRKVASDRDMVAKHPVPGLLVTGRLGRHNKRLLTHHVFEEAIDYLRR